MRASTRRTIWIVLAALLCVYVASYLAISRYSRAMGREDGPSIFLIPGICGTRDADSLEATHHFLACAYYPLWAAEHYLLGGPYCAHFPSTRLQGPRN